jgi:outer membrane murein-binding lipoprotein Lpp
LLIGTSLVIGPWALVIAASALLSGCYHPSEANIQLRKDKQQLEAQVAELQQQLSAANARIAGIEKEKGTLPTLPQDRLDKLVTVHGIKLGRLTGGDPASRPNAGDEGLKIYLTPVDETAEAIKVTGTVEVEAFDLDLKNENRIGHWTFDPDALKSRWRSFGMLRAFVLECPWQKSPQHSKLAVKVTFRDELTARVFDQIQEVTVKIPTTQPTTTATR